jgi:hypothetical protein
VRRIGTIAGSVLIVLGVFWVGRESTHGIGALWEHWWCPMPLVVIFLGLIASLAAARHRTSAA